MIDKEIFKKTEKKLRSYFSEGRKIDAFKYKITLLSEQIENINYKLKNIDISIPEEPGAITYGEKVQTSNNCTSYAERAVMHITQNLLDERARKLEKIADIEEEIRNIEEDNVIIENNIKNLNEEDREFLKVKYRGNLTDWKVGIILNMSQSKVTRKKQRLIEDISRWEIFVIIK